VEPADVLELRALLELTERLLTADDVEAVATALLASAVTMYGLPRGFVLTGGALQHSRMVARHGIAADAPRWPGVSPAVNLAHEQGVHQVVGPDSTDPVAAQLPSAGCHALVVSLRAEHRPVGALVLQLPLLLREQDHGPLADRLEICAGYAAAALHRVARLSSLQRLATTDDLTMIANRRGFGIALERELARSARLDEPVSLILLDLDYFKAINDEHGHPAGDDALRNVAAALTVACRDLDTAARYGGEEFAVLVPSCTPERAVTVAERMRAAVAAAPGVTRMSASAGVATYPDHAHNGDDLVAYADEALLLAKRSGRDRTVLSTARPAEKVARHRPRRSSDTDESEESDQIDLVVLTD
jgi:diguanylate cyclase (GGDEF)-like protein